MIVFLKGFFREFDIGISKIAILRADNSIQYQQSSQTGARSARHRLRPQTRDEVLLQLIVLLIQHVLEISVLHTALTYCSACYPIYLRDHTDLAFSGNSCSCD